jgi:hypothetical protein
VWLCSDFQPDGDHPNNQGIQKVESMLLNFFTTDPTASTWFNAPVS